MTLKSKRVRAPKEAQTITEEDVGEMPASILAATLAEGQNALDSAAKLSPETAAAAATEPGKTPEKGTKRYLLITPYPQVSPDGVRFLPNEPTLHWPTNWMKANVKAGLFKEV